YAQDPQCPGVVESEVAVADGTMEKLADVEQSEVNVSTGGEKEIRRQRHRLSHCSRHDDLDQAAARAGDSGAVESPVCIDRSPERDIARSGYSDLTAGAAETDRAAGTAVPADWSRRLRR